MVNFAQNKLNRWQDWGNLVLGAWLVLSPWLFGFTATTPAAWNAWIFGVIVIVLSIAALAKFAEWEEWVNALLGVWLIVSAWVIGFSAVQAALWNHVAVGILIAALSGWELWEVRRGGEHATA